MNEEKTSEILRSVLSGLRSVNQLNILTGEHAHVSYEAPGTGQRPLTVDDRDIKAAIGELLQQKDAEEHLLFRNKKQWWAVYKVLYHYCNYPLQMKSFEAKMKELDVAQVDGKRDLSYESLSAAVKDLPLMATSKPDAWHAMKDKSDNYAQQYEVAEFLMAKLGIKE